MKKIRVLVVDDSAFLRRNLPRILNADPEIEVIGTAANGLEAIQKVKDLRPDVVTLDVVMPVMDGLTALKQIMQENPLPVLMVSSMTTEGAKETLEALALGAVDYIEKPSGQISPDIEKIGGTLRDKIKVVYGSKIKMAAQANVTRERFKKIISDLTTGKDQDTPRAPMPVAIPQGKSLVAIATSTGGPAALQTILPGLPAELKAGVVIVQHISKGFTRPLADRLDSLSQVQVREAQDGEAIHPGVALLSPAGVHLTVVRASAGFRVRLTPEPSDSLHCPSANVLFESIAACCPGAVCAVILTGMGDDGAMGMQSIRARGGWTVAQDEASSVIYGMPRRAVELGGVALSLPLDQIAAHIARVTV